MTVELIDLALTQVVEADMMEAGVAIIGEDGNFFRGGAGPQFSPRKGRDFST